LGRRHRADGAGHLRHSHQTARLTAHRAVAGAARPPDGLGSIAAAGRVTVRTRIYC
jgi:hypothetical protein